MTEDKRKFVRIKSKLKSEVHSESDMTFSTSSNFSEGGVFISTPEPLTRGSTVEMSFHLPEEKTVTVKGVVRWTLENENEYQRAGMGIEFIDASKSLINELIESIKEE